MPVMISGVRDVRTENYSEATDKTDETLLDSMPASVESVRESMLKTSENRVISARIQKEIAD